MTEDNIPAWAIEIIKQVERLNEKIPNHIDWVERNMKDHEQRLRNLEQFRWLLLGLAIASGGIATGFAKWMGW
jgi:hypothetical protein